MRFIACLRKSCKFLGETMPIFRLERSEGNDMSKAELVIAQETNLELEKHLENWLENSPRQTLAREDFLWIGRQTSITDEDSTIFSDLLGIDSKGDLVIAELKKGRTPREGVAQLLDYAAWAGGLSESEIRKIAEEYFKNQGEFEAKLSMRPSEQHLICLKLTNFPNSIMDTYVYS